MTYFEWVEYFHMLQTSPMDYSLLEKAENKKLLGGEYVLSKLVNHVINTIKVRLTKSYSTCLNRIYKSNNDINTISLDLINFKKEKKFIEKIVNLSIFDEELKNIFINSINNLFNDMSNILKGSVTYVDNDGELTSVFEKIMLSSVEE